MNETTSVRLRPRPAHLRHRMGAGFAAGAAAVLAASVTGIVPADATHDVDRVSAVMLQSSDVRNSLGAFKSGPFQVDRDADRGPALCTTNGPEITGKVTDTVYRSVLHPAEGNPAHALRQEAFVYKSEGNVNRAWTSVYKKSQQCEGTFDTSSANGRTRSTVLTHGSAQFAVGGVRGVWVQADVAAQPGDGSWADDRVTVFMRAGRAVQLLEFEVPGTGTGVRQKQQVALQRMAKSLAERWIDDLGYTWH